MIVDVGGQLLEFPDSMTPDEIKAVLRRKFPAPVKETYDPTEGMSYGERLAAGAGSFLADRALGVKQMLGMATEQDAKDKEALDAPLLERSGAGVGRFLGGASLPVLAAMSAPGAATYAGAATIGGLLGLTDPVSEGDMTTERAKNTGLSALFGLLGQGAGNVIGSAIVKRGASAAAKAQSQAVANATKDATTKAGQALGYVVPPTHANPTMMNRLLEGLAGKLTTGQLAAEKNQAVTDLVVKRAIGIADDQPLTVGAVESVRKAAGQAYEALKGFGSPFKADKQYIDDLAQISSKSGLLGREIPELATKDVDQFVGAFARQEMGPDVAIEAIKKLRFDARALFKSDDPQKVAMAQASKKVADAIEGMIERNLAATGDDALLSQFRQARELIAKTHTVEDALTEGTGHVAARKLASQLAAGKPLSGELKDVAAFAQAYPKATQEITSSMPGISPLDFYGSGIVAAGAQNPLPLLYPLARIGARQGILSAPYQRAMTAPKYSGGELEQLLGGLLKKSSPVLGPLVYGSQQ